MHVLNASEEYIPRHRDSALASVRPEASFLDFFRQSLIYTSHYCTAAGCCSFADSSSEYGSLSRPVGNPPTEPGHDREPSLTYPLLLFEDLKDIPRRELLYRLASRFQSQVQQCTPFLADIAYTSTPPDQLPFYTLLAQALCGALDCPDTNPVPDLSQLWEASTCLLLGAVEVDNTLGRTISWHISVRTKQLLVNVDPLTYTTGSSISTMWDYLGWA